MLKSTERELIKEVFYEACQLTEDNQLSFIKQQCKNNKKLITEVESLLVSYKKSAAFFNPLAKNLLGNELTDDDDDIDLSPDPYNIIGTQINHYLILSKLGYGGMGIIYKAKDTRLNRIVALKFLPLFLLNDPIAIQRFRREATTASNIDHSNVGTIFSVEETDKGFPFISMAYYEGKNLEFISTNEQLNLEQYISIFIQICKGLEAAHNQGVIHRDIKPANIILIDNHCIKILDFGLAKMIDEHFTRTGIKMGTLAYMSPEHIKGEIVEQTSDIWSLGVLMFELTAKYKPFNGTTDPAVMHAVLNDEPKVAELNIPLTLKKILAKCLKKDKSERFQSASELCQALKDISLTKANRNSLDSNHLLHRFLLASKKRLKWFSLVLLTVSFIVVFYYQFNIELPYKQQLKIPVNKGIAVVNLQKDLTHYELGILSAVSQTLKKASENNANLWVITEDKTRDYQLTDLKKVNGLFGTNLILNTQLSKIENQYTIQLELLDSKTLKPVRALVAKQSSSNPISLKVNLDHQLLDLLNITNLNIHKNISQVETTKPEAYEAYVMATGFLERSDVDKNMEKAIELLKSAITYDPQYIAAMIKLADSYRWLYADKKDITFAKKAEKLYEKILTLNADEITSYISLAKLHNIQGRVGTALASYQLALKRSPNNKEIYTGMASVYEKSNQLDKAEEYFLKAIHISPNDWNSYNNLGGFFMRQNRYQDAITPFKKVVELTPGNSWGYNNLGVSYWYLNQIEKTIQCFRQSLTIKDDYSIYKNTASLYYYQHDFKQAINMYEKALQLNQNDYQVWGGLAISYFYANRNTVLVNNTLTKAIELALKNQSTTQPDHQITSSLAYYYAYLKQKKLSNDYLNILLSHDDLTARSANNIALIYAVLEQEDQAITWLKKAIKLGYAKQEILNAPEFNQLLTTQQLNALFENNNNS